MSLKDDPGMAAPTRNRRMKLRYCPNLTGDIAECDANYVRFQQLLRQLRDDEDRLEVHLDVGEVVGSRFRLQVLERSPYTLLVSIELAPANVSCELELLRWPVMQVRIYHDVRTAEVVTLQGAGQLKGRYDYPNRQMHHPDEKSQANRFLGEILSLCLSKGRCPVPLPLE